jgi:hypothetical protein
MKRVFICLTTIGPATFLMVWAVAALANAADPDDQIYEKSPDECYGLRDSSAGAAKTEQSEMSDPMAIEVVEISSKRVVLPSPKEALTPIHLRREPYWSNDSKHIALSFQTGLRTWTAMHQPRVLRTRNHNLRIGPRSSPWNPLR